MGTAASKLPDQVLHENVKERTGALRALGQEKREAFYRSCLGHMFMVLAEGWESEPESLAKGLSDNYLKVLFQSPKPVKNEMIPVIPQRLYQGGLLAKVINLAN